MAKLSDLKLTPEEREEREARRRERRGRIAGIVARAEPHRRAEEPSRGDLHALLDACLDLSEMRAPDGWRAAVEGGEDDAVAAARVLGRALARGAFGWTEPDAPLAEWPGGGRETWPSLERWPVLWRREAARRLERSPHVLPPPLVRALAGALLGLNDGSGEVPRLLPPHREPGRGRNPGEARWMEEVAWCWIHRQKGAGRRIADGVADVARAVHRGADAVKKWREAWEGRDGKEEVKGELARHREIGAGREPPPYALPDLPEIAERWLAAVEPPRGGEG